ncbi:lysM domain-containing protein [Colletotrichum tofieldiae]|nr:LysM domain-containing protein [Colletotrichum tofieldiae]GKT69261.1 lysM domain-containing protein [Colletotrichum tofieldiae]GKT96445.1 lysM domain-containing protein [Colletotrichum tofieldiae]
MTYDCQDIASLYDVTVDDLVEWNPDLAVTPGLESACEFQGGFRYCVSPDERRWPDMTEYCVRETVAEPGWSCADYAFWFGLNITHLNEWNPNIGRDCENYQTAGNNGCDQFVNNIKIPQARFVAWNPSVGSDCSGVVKNYDYCVAIPSWQPPA